MVPTMVTFRTGTVINEAEGAKIKARLAKVGGVSRVDVLHPDRVLVTYDSPRVRLSTLKAVLGGREAKTFSVNRK